jgi:beta-mannosidase
MRIQELHAGWQARAKDHAAMPWVPATVPGHLHPDLQAAGIIPDPFYRMQEITVQWIDELDWEYKTSFTPEAAQEGERQVLRFEGLDSVGDIWLNGSLLGSFESMHIPLEFDVSGKLLESNELRITFRSPRQVGREKGKDWLEEQGLPASTGRLPERAFVRKAQYMYGWDWGPELASCGVWMPVRLITTKGRIQWVWPRQVRRDDGSFMLSLSSQVEGEGSIRYRLTGPLGDVWQAEEPDAQILIASPQLWWPHNQGPQSLYTLTTELVADGEVIDSHTQKIGFRTIEVVETPDEQGASWEFVINGRRVNIVGSNWIPDHSFPSLPTRERIFTQVRIAKEMNHNMLRVWGGGIFETEDFYDACDEMGILVWQDFPYGCSYSPDSQPWRDLAIAEAEAQVPRLRGRTSLAIWCGNNENQTMHESRWSGDDTPERFLGEVIWEEDLPNALKNLDPDRHYISSSPTGTKGSGNGDDRGDVHNWNVWHGRGTWRNYHESNARFVSEFGFASSCSLQAWETCLSEEDKLDPRSPAVAWHDKTRKGYATFLSYIEDEYPSIQTLDDLVYYGQLNQRDAMRFALHHYRTSPWCRGALIWQLNDCWPVQSWALVDFSQVIKAAGEEMKRCFDNVLVVVQPLESEVELWLINDSPDSVTGDVKSTVFSTRTGDAKGAWSFTGQTLAPGERRKLKTWAREEFNDDSLVMEASYGSFTPCVSLLQKPKDTTFGVPKVTVKSGKDGQVLSVAGAPAIDLMIRETDHSPRFVTIIPGRPVVVQGPGLAGRSVRTLAGETTVLRG